MNARTLNIAVLCPGPGLAGFLERAPRHDQYIAVNRAAEAFAADWWCFGDAVAFDKFTPISQPSIFTCRGAWDRIENREALAKHETWRLWDEIGTTCPPRTGWTRYSLPAALVLAEHLGAARITVYGADWNGDADWDGLAADNRNDERWTAERRHYGLVKTWLAARGIAVVRAGHDDVKAETLIVRQTRPLPQGRTWLILGSSPSAAAYYPEAKAVADVICTANNGLVIEPMPDLYWLTDSVAVRRYGDLAREAVARGSHLVTSTLGLKHNAMLGEIAETVLKYDYLPRRHWMRGTLCNGRTSGGLLAQLAILNGASRVLMVGMEGYRSGHGETRVDYFDGRDGSAHHDETMAFYGPLLQSVIDQTPTVEWVWYGRPNYPWSGPNVRIVEHAPAPAGGGA
jgi:hypothetical protein